MANHLLIVESPAKSKTIGKFLGKDFTVLPSYGHIRDLKTKGMGVDVDNNYDPQYEISDDKKSVVSTLKAAAKKADHIGSLPMKTARVRRLRGTWRRCLV